MTFVPVELQAPLLLVLSGIGLCIVFETAGLSEGFRRHGNKSYISLIAFAMIASVFFVVFRAEKVDTVAYNGLIFDHFSRSAILSLSALCFGVLWITIERLRPTNSDRGELYALILFALFCNIIACAATSHILFGCAFFASLISQIGIIGIRKRRRTSSEIALKMTLSGLFALVLLGAVFAFESTNQMTAVIVCLITFVLFFSSVVPLQTLHVDILDGAPSYSAALFSASTLITMSTILTRLASDPALTPTALETLGLVFLSLGAVTLCVAPIMALDQRRMSRVLAYLQCGHAAMVLMFASLAFMHVKIPSYLHGFLFTHVVLCIAGIFAGQNLWKNTKYAFKTWEDFAGAGRHHPIESGAFFVVLLSVIGFPFTTGFVLRSAMITLAPSHLRPIFVLIVLVNIVASAVPVFRLFAFFFGKTTRHELHKHHFKSRRVLLLGLCASFAIAFALVPISILNLVFDLGQQ